MKFHSNAAAPWWESIASAADAGFASMFPEMCAPGSGGFKDHREHLAALRFFKKNFAGEIDQEQAAFFDNEIAIVKEKIAGTYEARRAKENAEALRQNAESIQRQRAAGTWPKSWDIQDGIHAD
jgi:hypothetical protein